jgi:hypothetical protein
MERQGEDGQAERQGQPSGELNFWGRVMARLGRLGRQAEGKNTSDEISFSGYYVQTNSYPVTMGATELNLEATYAAIANVGDYYETAMQTLADAQDPNIADPSTLS